MGIWEGVKNKMWKVTEISVGVTEMNSDIPVEWEQQQGRWEQPKITFKNDRLESNSQLNSMIILFKNVVKTN